MVLPCVTLVGFLVPVLVTPLGLLALRVLGVVTINMVDGRGSASSIGSSRWLQRRKQLWW